MRVDLLTLYLLAVGTLIASCGLTLWEQRSYPRRRKELSVLAAGYAVLAAGCAAALVRHNLPGAFGSALSNLVIVSGYLLNMQGVALLNGRRYRRLPIGVLVLLALAWAIAGKRWEEVMWAYLSAIPIAVVCGLTTRELMRMSGPVGRQARSIAIVVAGGHALFYAFRAVILPWMAASFGPGALAIAGKITMYEGVLYSVILPMTLLKFVRDEAHADLLRESQTDYLTGLGNRRWFFAEAERAMRASDSAHPLACLALDLDNFKAINDRFGHEAGDEVLKSFAKVARDVLSEHAIFARMGGEEFVALLPSHDGRRARETGESVIRRFAQTVSHEADGVQIRVTVSIGMALSGKDADTLTELLAAGDRALYSAKSLGGNRLESAYSAASRKDANVERSVG
jgi:diguanylate cyclase (GGDEF)-like protein